VLNVGTETVPDDLRAPCEEASLKSVLAALEQQLAALDALGARVAAAHVSAAVEHLRLDALEEEIAPRTQH
jgi:hypothetical protein